MENEVINALCERRAVRGYKPGYIEDEKLEAILKAGTYAPTGMGNQSPIIIAVTNPEVREKLRAMNANIIGNPELDPFYGAQTILIVLADKSMPTYMYDGALVMGNLMNAAHSMGVSSVWVHRAKEEFETPEGKALLKEWGIEGDYEGIGHCVLGYAAEAIPVAKPRKSNYVTYVK